MSREPDAGLQPEPGTDAQDTEDAVTGTGTRPPDGDSGCDRAGPDCEPSVNMLALPSRPGTRARMLVTACADEHGEVLEGVPAGQDPGWVLGDGDVVVDIAWPGGPGSHRGTDVAVRQMICGDLVLVARWEGLGSGWPERVRPAVAAVMKLYCAVELAGGEIYLQPPEQWPPEPVMVPAAGLQPQLAAESPGVWPGMLAPLLEAGVLQPGEILTWRRRNIGTSYTVTVLPGGALQTADGRVHATVCAATAHACGRHGSNGWLSWRRADGLSLDSLRQPLLARYPHLYSSRTASAPQPDSPERSRTGHDCP